MNVYIITDLLKTFLAENISFLRNNFFSYFFNKNIPFFIFILAMPFKIWVSTVSNFLSLLVLALYPNDYQKVQIPT